MPPVGLDWDTTTLYAVLVLAIVSFAALLYFAPVCYLCVSCLFDGGPTCV